MTRKLLKRLALAAAVALAASTTFAASNKPGSNTLPFPQLPDPTEACHRDFARVADQCIANDQQGYNVTQGLWSQLSQLSAEMCDKAYGMNSQVAREDPAQLWAGMGDCVMQLYGYQPLPPQTFNKW